MVNDKKTLLITGGLGFIGFNYLVMLFKNNQSDIPKYVINIDNETYAAQYKIYEKKKYLKQFKQYRHFKYDICNYKKLEKVIKKYNVTHIINFAAESHVDNSIKNPGIFIETNIKGTQTLLDLTRKYNIRFHQVSTDEVYGSVHPYNDNVTEKFKLNPSSPYSASKTAADLLVKAYVKTFGINATISRCTNNYGPWQHPEKLLPKVITNALLGIKIPIYGDGKQLRNWIYVEDHCKAIEKIINCNTIKGEIYNIGSKTLLENIDICKSILKQINKTENLIEYVKDRPGHDLCYHLCSDKIKNEFNWEEQTTLNQGLYNTIEFYNNILFKGKILIC